MSRKAPKPAEKPAEPSAVEAAAIVARQNAEDCRRCGEAVQADLDRWGCHLVPQLTMDPSGYRFGFQVAKR